MKSLGLESQLLTGEAQKASLMHSDGSISILGPAILPFPTTTRPFEFHYITTLDATSPCNDIFNISPCVMVVPLWIHQILSPRLMVEWPSSMLKSTCCMISLIVKSQVVPHHSITISDGQNPLSIFIKWIQITISWYKLPVSHEELMLVVSIASSAPFSLVSRRSALATAAALGFGGANVPEVPRRCRVRKNGDIYMGRIFTSIYMFYIYIWWYNDV